MYVHQLIFLKKKTIRRIFILKIFTRRFYYEDTKDGKEDKLVAQFCNFPFSRRSDFIFQLKFFSHGEWLSTCMQNLSFRRNWKKSGAYHYLFFPSPPPLRFSSLHLWGWTIVFEELSTLTSTRSPR